PVEAVDLSVGPDHLAPSACAGRPEKRTAGRSRGGPRGVPSSAVRPRRSAIHPIEGSSAGGANGGKCGAGAWHKAGAAAGRPDPARHERRARRVSPRPTRSDTDGRLQKWVPCPWQSRSRWGTVRGIIRRPTVRSPRLELQATGKKETGR